MILVLFFIITILILMLIFFSYIKVDLDDIYISNIPKFNYSFRIKFGIYLFNKIKILGFTVNDKELKKSRWINKIKLKMKNEPMDISVNEIIKLIKKAKINLDMFNTKIKIGTEDVILTSAIVGIVASSIGIVLGKLIKHYEDDKYMYEILPVFNNKNIFDMKLNCIINTKLVHIIYVIYMFSKKRSENKYERTSNRRSYDYSYE